MNVLTVIKKIGDTVISVVEWPFKHASQVANLIGDAMKDEPEAKTVIVGLVEQFEAIDADVVSAIAASGLNVVSDMKAAADVQALFIYFKNTFVPAMEKVYADMEKDSGPAPAPAPAAAAVAPAVAPGLHNVVPA